MPWWAAAIGAGAELWRGLSPSFCTQCPWSLIVLLLLVCCCLGFCLGGLAASVALSPLLRRALLAAFRTVVSGLQSPLPAGPARRRLAEYVH